MRQGRRWPALAVGNGSPSVAPWYLGGDKAKGQQIFDAVTAGAKKVEGSDWARIARIYVEANEWPKAAAAYEKVIAADPGDDTTAIEYRGELNLHKDRAKAEALFAKTMSGKKASETWHFINAGGSYRREAAIARLSRVPNHSGRKGVDDRKGRPSPMSVSETSRR